MANPGNVAGGLKATLHNPNVSDEAKQHAEYRLENDFGIDVGNQGRSSSGQEDYRFSSGQDFHSTSGQESGYAKDPDNIKRGIKAAIHNPNVSEGKKEELRQKLGGEDL